MEIVKSPTGPAYASDYQSQLDSGGIRRDQIPKEGFSCPECEQTAYFVRRSKDGRPAHFSAHHEEDCDQSGHTVTTSDARPGGTKAAPVRKANTVDLIVLPPSPPSSSEHRRRAAPGAATGAAVQHQPDASPTDSTHTPTTGLSALLANLRKNPDFAQQLHDNGRQLAGIDGTSETDPLELIQSFKSLYSSWRERLGQKIIIWGRFFDVGYHAKSDRYYINQGPYGQSLGALRVDPATAQALAARYEPPRGIITGPEELRSGWVIAVGTVRSTSNNDNLVVSVDPGCAFIAPRERAQYRSTETARARAQEKFRAAKQ